jgi:hypothetical protein
MASVPGHQSPSSHQCGTHRRYDTHPPGKAATSTPEERNISQWIRSLRFEGRPGAVLRNRSPIRNSKGLVFAVNGYVLLVLTLCGLFSATGCVKQTLIPGVPFGLDKLTTTKAVPPEDPLKEKGLRLVKEKKFKEALEVFTQFVTEKPENFFGFNALAVCYKNLGDSANAAKNYERALEFADSPEERAKVLGNIGNLYSAEKRDQVALGYYKEAAAEFERNPLYLILISRSFLRLHEKERARKVLADAEKLREQLDKYERDEDRGLGFYLMADSYLTLDNVDKSSEYLERAVQVNPQRYGRKIARETLDPSHSFHKLKNHPRISKLLSRYAQRPGPDADAEDD